MSRILSERAAISTGLLLVGIGLMVSTFGLDFADLGGAFDPTFFPQIILLIWIVLAALSLVQDLVQTQRSAPAKWGVVAAVSLAVLAFALLITTLGFLICGVVFCALILVLTGQRRPVEIAAFAVLLPLGLDVLFAHVLHLPLPSSPVVWWL